MLVLLGVVEATRPQMAGWLRQAQLVYCGGDQPVNVLLFLILYVSYLKAIPKGAHCLSFGVFCYPICKECAMIVYKVHNDLFSPARIFSSPENALDTDLLRQSFDPCRKVSRVSPPWELRIALNEIQVNALAA